MLLPDNIYPQNSIYYNGAMVLKILQDSEPIELLDLFNKVREKQAMSLPIFILCLDWLYLIDVAELKEKKIQLCF